MLPADCLVCLVSSKMIRYSLANSICGSIHCMLMYRAVKKVDFIKAIFKGVRRSATADTPVERWGGLAAWLKVVGNGMIIHLLPNNVYMLFQLLCFP
jgi:hypothetical protein